MMIELNAEQLRAIAHLLDKFLEIEQATEIEIDGHRGTVEITVQVHGAAMQVLEVARTQGPDKPGYVLRMGE